jgi:hypothetical protein
MLGEGKLMSRRELSAALAISALLNVMAITAERDWQSGIWREAKVERPKVQFSVQSRDPNSSLPRTATARETRTFVIETSTHRLELRQDATVDTPRIDALIGGSVLIAVEKKIVYVKDGEGKEHKLSLRKVTPLAR